MSVKIFAPIILRHDREDFVGCANLNRNLADQIAARVLCKDDLEYKGKYFHDTHDANELLP